MKALGGSEKLMNAGDKFGLVTRYKLSSKRGYAFALNPKFPLVNEVRQLLIALSRDYPTKFVSDVTDAESKVPPLAFSVKNGVDVLFGSALRFRTLAALEASGGSIEQRIYCQIVPGEFYFSVSTLLRLMIRGGLLEKKDGRIMFAALPWTRQLRALLKAYLRQNTDFVKAVQLRGV